MTLSSRKKLAFKVFQHYKKNTSRLHELNSLFWECTLRCNLNCLHCGSDCTTDATRPDMPLQDFLPVLDSIKKEIPPSKVFIIFSGGEPLMRKDLEECGRAVSKKGFQWGMVTNGLALTENRLESLMQAGLSSISISLDGLKQSHNKLRNNPSSFSKAVNAIQLIADTELAFDVISCVSGYNINELQQLKELLISLGVKHWRINTIFPVGRGEQNNELQLEPAQFSELMEFIVKTRKEKKIKLEYSCEGFLDHYEGKVRDSFFFCRAGINIGSVLVDGSISGCTNMRSNFIQGNIYDDDFMKVWNNRFENYRDRSWTQKGICNDCAVFPFCEGNGLHLYDENEELKLCHLKKLQSQ